MLNDTGVDFISSNNVANLGSFAKVSVPVGSIIPWFIVAFLVVKPSRVHELTTLKSKNSLFVTAGSLSKLGRHYFV